MKKIISIFLLLALSLASLVSCGSSFLEGEYTCVVSGITFMTMEFEDGNVIRTSRSGKITNGTYEVENSTVKISWEDGKGDVMTFHKETESLTIFDLEDFVFKKTK